MRIAMHYAIILLSKKFERQYCDTGEWCFNCVMRVRDPKNDELCWELCKWIPHCHAVHRRSRNKRNVGGCWLKEFDWFQTWRNNSQQHTTTCSMVYKRTQHATPKNIENCWPTMLRPFANSFILEIVSASVFTVHKVCVTNRSKRPYDSLFQRFNSRQNSSCTSKQPIFAQRDELVWGVKWEVWRDG